MLRPLRLIVFVLTSFWAFCAQAESPTVPRVVDGQLDLSTWDFERDGPISLEGDWRFWWNQLLDPSTLLEAPDGVPNHGYFPVPQNWNRVENPDTPGSNYGESGYATLAVSIKLPADTDTTLGLFLSNADLAYSIHGKRGSTPLPAMGNGVVSTTSDREVPLYLPRLVTIPQSSADTIELVWHLSSHRHTRGGPSASPRAASSTRTGYGTALRARPRAR